MVAITQLGAVRSTRLWLEGVVDHLAINLTRTGERRARLFAIWGSGEAAKPDEDEVDPWN